MVRLPSCTVIALLLAAACDGGQPMTIASSALNHDTDVIPLLADVSASSTGDVGPVIVSTLDGSVQEEVVYADALPSPSSGADVLEVPEIIADALRDAPGPAVDCGQVIVKNEDGSVQEEVVFLDSDDELGSWRSTEETPAAEVAVAALQVPDRR